MTQPAPARPAGLRLGMRANLGQFCLLVGVNALVGGMVGQERSLLSLLATQVFGLAAVSAALTYIVAFGLTKAATIYAERVNARIVLIDGPELAQLMVEHNCVVRVEETFVLKEVDEDFFDEN